MYLCEVFVKWSNKMMKEIVFATHNAHKASEIRNILGDSVKVKTLTDINLFEEIPENGNTFEENSFIKADFVRARVSDFTMCIADDSGLMVEALDGAPGVFSARYAGEPADDKRNVAKLLDNLKGVENRRAKFITVITALINDKSYSFRGEIEGVIIDECRGTNGFGYDPVFVPDGYDLTFAQLPSEVKNSISHRARAIRKFVEFFNNL